MQILLRVIALLAASVAGMAAASEPARSVHGQMVETLRARKYFDTAIDYLEQLRTDSTVPAEFRQQIDYQIGMARQEEGRAALTVASGQAAMAAAATAMERFLAEHPDHATARDARLELANILADQAQLTLTAAKATGEAKSIEAAIASARETYEKARKVLEESVRRSLETAKLYQDKVLDPQSEQDKITERDAARRNLVRGRLMLATLEVQLGKTWPADSKDYRSRLTAAAERYREISDKYLEYDAQAIAARILEGQTYLDLNRNDEAANVFRQLLALPDDLPYRPTKLEAWRLLLETLLKPESKAAAEAASRAADWDKWAGEQEKASPEGQQIYLLAARAALAQARSVGAADAKQRDFTTAARRYLDGVVRRAGPLRREALTLLADPLLGGAKAPEGAPRNYAEARDRGNLAWDVMIGLMAEAQGTNGAARSDVEVKLAQARFEALENYRLAEALKGTDASLDELSLMRFRQAYLYWAENDLYRASVLGEFLARRYPQSETAAKAAEIAVKAYRTLVIDGRTRGEPTNVEQERMVALAAYMGEIWKGRPEAEEAQMMLIDTSIDAGDVDAALAQLAAIPEDSPRRGRVEIRVGLSLWRAYALALRQEEGQRDAARIARLLQLSSETLQRGLGRVRPAIDAGTVVDEELAAAVLALAEVLIVSGKPTDAVRWLEDPKLGPETLVAAKAPAAARADFQRNTLLISLRAHIGAQQWESAEKTIASLESMATEGSDADAAARLTETYILLGRQLEDLLARLRGQGRVDEVARVSKSFDVFLGRIAERPQGTNFAALSWVATTLESLGKAIEGDAATTPPEAKEYYRKAAAVYYEILKRASQDPKFLPSDAEVGVQIRLAGCLRMMGQYEQALKQVARLLGSHERRIELQREAAAIYQDWAAMPGKSAYYLNAILGAAEQNGRKLIWGWGGIAQRAAAEDRYQDIFHEARYNLATCRMRLAITRQGDEKNNLLEQAELDITRVQALYPQMGGPAWMPKYDSLLRTIRGLRGQKEPRGLK